ncbi:MAG: translation initiation factor IF-2 [Bacillota bacterium]
MNPRELLKILNELGANVKNHMSFVEEQYVQQVRKTYAAGARTVTVRPTTMPIKPAAAASPSTTAATVLPVKEKEEVAPPKAVAPPPAPAQPASPPPAPPRPKAQPAAKTPAGEQEKKEAKPVKPAAEEKPAPAPRRPAPVIPPPPPPAVPPKRVRGQKRTRREEEEEEEERFEPRLAGKRGQAVAGKEKARAAQPGKAAKAAPTEPPRPAAPAKRTLELPPVITVKELAGVMALPVGEVIKKLMAMGVLATINQEIDYDAAAIVAQEYGHEVRPAPSLEDKLKTIEIVDPPEVLVPRPPVVTVMGHVDHGKTSLLDAIRETNVTAQEAGGITQHIGAYQVEIKGRKITFLDTPGHEAFTAMRARGAQVTDIAVLVVAADDGVMPQTVEAINHAKAAGIPIIVAINKIDKPQANPERVKQELTEYGLVAEEWGGDTVMVEVSALKRIGLDHLLEMILLVADLRDLRANPDRPAKGTIIEAELDKGRGPVATVLVQNGTLEMGDTVIAGAVVGRVRALVNDKGKRVRKAGPSTPVEVIGLDGLPMAGDELFAIKDEHLARELAAQRQQLKRESELRRLVPMTLNDLFNRVQEGELKELKLIVKADVHGSVEALRQSLERIANEQVKVVVIHAGVGAITESDVMLASASNAIIIGFNVRPDPAAKRAAEKERVEIKLYRVIYDAIADIEAALEGMRPPEYREVVLGRAEVRAVFKVPKVGNVAGCYVTEGKILRGGDARVLRDHVVVYEGKIESLKRFKDDVREVQSGFECGIGLERFNDIKEGDVIEVYTMEEIKRETKKP